MERTVEYDPNLRVGEREVVDKSYVSERITLKKSKEKRVPVSFDLQKYVLNGKELYSRKLFSDLKYKRYRIVEIIGEPL